jgi:hypothetical protein
MVRMNPASILELVFARSVGVRVYGLGAVALGLVGLAWGDFAAVWQPVPAGVPGRLALAYAVAMALLLSGLTTQWQRSAKFGALALTALYALGVVLLHVPRVIAHPAVFVSWSGVAEQMALVAGGLVAYAGCASVPPAVAARIVKIGRLIFGVCLVVFGLAQRFWAYATAAGHFAAGIAFLSGVAVRPAAMWLTGMFVVFGVLVHAPTIFIDPHTHINWAANAINFALIGSAWVMAARAPLTTTLERIKCGSDNS